MDTDDFSFIGSSEDTGQWETTQCYVQMSLPRSACSDCHPVSCMFAEAAEGWMNYHRVLHRLEIQAV